MKKILLSLALIVVFVVYAVEQHLHPADSKAPEVSDGQNTAEVQSAISTDIADARPGQLININGTIYLVNNAGLLGFPSLAVFNSWGYNLNNITAANSAEQALTMLAVVPTKTNPDCASPLNQILNNCGAVAVAPAPTQTPGEYKDGQYTGSVANSIFGNIQVQAIIQNGKLADVQFLTYPNDKAHSVQVSQMAIPLLTSEAIAAQSANVDIVSGATQDSHAFEQSLSSALAQAKS